MAAGLLKEKAAQIRRLARAHGVARLRVFGSYASGVAREASDLDLLVDLEPERDLLDLAGFKLDLEDLLGCKVDVVTEAALSPYLRDHILSQTKPL
jgi:predicted nucleotidyltransferase